jgi:hypothetical protein
MSAAIVGAIGGGFLAAGAAEATAMSILGGAAAGAGLGSTVGRALGAGSSGGATSGYGGSQNLAVYDPYSPYRAGAAADLQNLMKNPATAMSSPGYQQQLQQGTRAQEAAAASGGKLQSGAESAALTGLGQSTFSSYYNTMLGQLSGLSGATQSPASAAQASQAGAVSGAGQSVDNISSLLKGVSGLQQATNFLGGPVNQNLSNSSYMNPNGYQGYGDYSYFPPADPMLQYLG